MWNRYWNYTTCINCTDINAIGREITNLFVRQGATCAKDLPPSYISIEKFRQQHISDQTSYAWIVALYSGREGWAIVKTYPSELLCHYVTDDYDYYSQLSALTMALKCDAFHLSVHGGDAGFLLEANAKGTNWVSGGFGSNSNIYFYKQPINTSGKVNKFSLLNMPSDIKAAISINQSPALQQRLAEIKKSIEENPELALNIDLEFELHSGHYEKIDEALQSCMDKSENWRINDLGYRIYTSAKKIDLFQMHLLYFKPLVGYKVSHEDLSPKQELELYDTLPESIFNKEIL
ncbi:MAG: hypothetical protein AAFQ80_06535 [Cyanobacteria bacterium J06621_8]